MQSNFKNILFGIEPVRVVGLVRKKLNLYTEPSVEGPRQPSVGAAVVHGEEHNGV